MTNTSTTTNPGDLITLTEINQLTGYSNPIVDYQMLRKKGVNPVSYRKNPSGGGGIGEYLKDDVLTALANRLSKRRSDAARAAAEAAEAQK